MCTHGMVDTWAGILNSNKKPSCSNFQLLQVKCLPLKKKKGAEMIQTSNKKKASYSVCAAYTLIMFKSHDTCLTSSTHQKRLEDQLVALEGKGKRQKKEHSS